VIRVAVDSEVGVWEALGQELAIFGVHHGVVVVDGHEGGLDDACEAVEHRGVGDAPGGDRRQLGVAGRQVGGCVPLDLSALRPFETCAEARSSHCSSSTRQISGR
jgi:hypothetical protein